MRHRPSAMPQRLKATAMALDGASFAAPSNAVAQSTARISGTMKAPPPSLGSGSDTSILTEFARPRPLDMSKPDEQTWSATPPSAAGYLFVRVTTSVTMPLYSFCRWLERPEVRTNQGCVSGGADSTGTHSRADLLPFSADPACVSGRF